MKIDPTDVCISVEKQFIYNHDSDAPEDFVYIYNGFIYIDDLDKGLINVGKYKLCYVNMDEVLNCGASVYDVFDVSGQLFELYEEMYDEDGNINGDILNAIKDHNLFENILMLERIEIKPRFRGNNITKVVIDMLIKRHGGNVRFAILKPFPLQLEGFDENNKSIYKKFSKDEKVATKKLISLYEQCGFVKIKDRDIMIRGIN